MKRPAFQFYPADWRKDPALSACSLAARGLWIELMCIAHESDEYGVLSINGKAMNDAQLARMVGESPAVLKKLLEELDDAAVFSRRDDGAIFSRRMVKDERIRNVRAEAGKLGGNPDLLNQKVKQTAKQTEKQKPTPSSSSSTSVNSVEPTSTAKRNSGPTTDSPPTRFLEIVKLLMQLEAKRGKQIAPIVSSNKAIRGWVAANVTDATVREAHGIAVSERERAGDANPVNPNFLNTFIAKIMNPQGDGVTPIKPKVWHDSNDAVEKRGKELGLRWVEYQEQRKPWLDYKADVLKAAGETE